MEYYKYRYFVTFRYLGEEAVYTTEVKRIHPLASMDDVTAMELLISVDKTQDVKTKNTIKVLSWQRFEEPE